MNVSVGSSDAWMGVNTAVGRVYMGFKGRDDRQEHGQRKRQVAGRQTVTNNRLERNVRGDRLAVSLSTRVTGSQPQ